MAITAQDYQLRAGESISDYNARIASLRGETTTPVVQQTQTTGKTNEQVLAESTRVAQEAAEMIGTTFTPGYTTTTQVQPITTTQPEPPTPTASKVSESYFTSLTQNLDTQRTAVEDAYKKQIEELNKQIDESKKRVDEITAKQETTLAEAEPLTEPFREALEASERQRLSVEENYFANQALVNELDTLLTEGNQLIQQQKDITGLASIREPRIQKTINDISARTGVIEAVMNARNGQIAQAYTLIDRTTEAITADRQDQLNYYNTLLSFYDSQKDEEGNKLLTLTSEQKKYVEAQIGLLESDLANTQENIENIKQAMTDPDLAMTYAQAGITLNDSPEQINKKLADYAYTQEVSNTSNEMSLSGYTFLAPNQSAPDGYEVISTTDSKGNVKRWYKKKEDSDINGITEEKIKTILFNVGIPTAVSTSKGELNKSYYDKLVKALTPIAGEFTQNVIDVLWEAIINGNDFETIRKLIRDSGSDPSILDVFVQTLQGETSEIPEPEW